MTDSEMNIDTDEMLRNLEQVRKHFTSFLQNVQDTPDQIILAFLAHECGHLIGFNVAQGKWKLDKIQLLYHMNTEQGFNVGEADMRQLLAERNTIKKENLQ